MCKDGRPQLYKERRVLLELLHLGHRLSRNRQATRADVKADRFNAQVRQVFLESSPGNPDLVQHKEESHIC